MKLIAQVMTGGETEFARSWDVPNPSDPKEFRQFLTRLQTQLNTFVESEENN